jgi:predicted GH43/DUF377 family glycosyl hydrolase
LTDIFYKEYLNQFNDHVVLTSRFDHEISYVGGCPPIETAHGWLLIYHGVKMALLAIFIQHVPLA